MNINKHVGQRVKELRKMKGKGFNQQWLGDVLGCTYQQVQKCEKGTNHWNETKLWKTAKALNVKVQDLFPADNETGFFIDEDTCKLVAATKGLDPKYIKMLATIAKTMQPK